MGWGPGRAGRAGRAYEEFNGSGILILGRLGDPEGRTAQRSAQRSVNVSRRRDLNDLLVSQLDLHRHICTGVAAAHHAAHRCAVLWITAWVALPWYARRVGPCGVDALYVGAPSSRARTDGCNCRERPPGLGPRYAAPARTQSPSSRPCAHTAHGGSQRRAASPARGTAALRRAARPTCVMNRSIKHEPSPNAIAASCAAQPHHPKFGPPPQLAARAGRPTGRTWAHWSNCDSRSASDWHSRCPRPPPPNAACQIACVRRSTSSGRAVAMAAPKRRARGRGGHECVP